MSWYQLFCLMKKWTISDQEQYQSTIEHIRDQVGFDWSDSCGYEEK